MSKNIGMIRESDEACFELIAAIRDQRALTPNGPLSLMESEIERLLGNLEARIDRDQERATSAFAQGYDAAVRVERTNQRVTCEACEAHETEIAELAHRLTILERLVIAYGHKIEERG